MNSPTEGSSDPVFEPDLEATYSIEFVVEQTGLSDATITLYKEEGLIAISNTFNDETLHKLQRIEHLRQRYEVNVAGLKLMLDLLDEVEQLRRGIRSRR
jgi:DNA-binding transcriptional MerR regulator